MSITTISSRDFNQHKGRATKAASSGPVVITDRGKPSFVLMSFEEYRRITGEKINIIDALAMPGVGDIDIEFPRHREIPREIDFDFD